MPWHDAMADFATSVNDFFAFLFANPGYLLLLAGGIAAFVIFVVARHIHKIRSEDIFVHQAWGANWKGR